MHSHPKDKLVPGNLILTNFALELQNHFPQYKLKVLRFISKKFIYKRLGHMNTLINEENKARNLANAQKRAKKLANSEKKVGYESLRAKRKTLEFAYNNWFTSPSPLNDPPP